MFRPLQQILELSPHHPLPHIIMHQQILALLFKNIFFILSHTSYLFVFLFSGFLAQEMCQEYDMAVPFPFTIQSDCVTVVQDLNFLEGKGGIVVCLFQWNM